MKREVFSCDHCGIDVAHPFTFTVFDGERHLCTEHAGQLEFWIKTSMAEINGVSAEIVVAEKE